MRSKTWVFVTLTFGVALLSLSLSAVQSESIDSLQIIADLKARNCDAHDDCIAFNIPLETDIEVGLLAAVLEEKDVAVREMQLDLIRSELEDSNDHKLHEAFTSATSGDVDRANELVTELKDASWEGTGGISEFTGHDQGATTFAHNGGQFWNYEEEYVYGTWIDGRIEFVGSYRVENRLFLDNLRDYHHQFFLDIQKLDGPRLKITNVHSQCKWSRFGPDPHCTSPSLPSRLTHTSLYSEGDEYFTERGMRGGEKMFIHVDFDFKPQGHNVTLSPNRWLTAKYRCNGFAAGLRCLFVN